MSRSIRNLKNEVRVKVKVKVKVRVKVKGEASRAICRIAGYDINYIDTCRCCSTKSYVPSLPAGILLFFLEVT